MKCVVILEFKPDGQVKTINNGSNKKYKIINNTFNHTCPDIPFEVLSPINASRDENKCL